MILALKPNAKLHYIEYYSHLSIFHPPNPCLQKSIFGYLCVQHQLAPEWLNFTLYIVEVGSKVMMCFLPANVKPKPKITLPFFIIIDNYYDRFFAV